MGLCRSLDDDREIALSTSGKRLWSCDGPECEKRRVPWGKKWRWFGSYKDWENDPFSVYTLCGDKCQSDFDAIMHPEKPEARNL